MTRYTAKSANAFAAARFTGQQAGYAADALMKAGTAVAKVPATGLQKLATAANKVLKLEKLKGVNKKKARK